MKRPAFQFYPADWRKDLELGACSFTTRGIWFEMLCVMHEARPYGFMAMDGRAIPDQAAANLVRVPLPAYRRAIGELETNGVFSRTEDGLIYCRRMVRDERLRNVRADAGKLGGNPNLVRDLVNQNESKPPPEVNLASKQVPTPSSSASASTATSTPAVDGTPDTTARANGSHGRVKIQEKQGKTDSWSTPEWVAATAETFGMQRRNGESDAEFSDRVHTQTEARQRKAEAETKRRNEQVEAIQQLIAAKRLT